MAANLPIASRSICAAMLVTSSLPEFCFEMALFAKASIRLSQPEPSILERSCPDNLVYSPEVIISVTISFLKEESIDSRDTNADYASPILDMCSVDKYQGPIRSFVAIRMKAPDML